MLLSDWRVLTRRWYVILLGILATAGLAFVALTLIPVRYQVTANVLILPPKSVNEAGKVTNPYLDLGGLEGVTDVVAQTLTEQSAAQAIQAMSPSAKYTVLRDPASAAPVILITVSDTSASSALAIQTSLLDRIPQALATIQQRTSVHSDSLITSSPITQDSKPTVLRKSQLRAMVVIVVGGLGMTYLLAALIDGLLRSRKNEPAAKRAGVGINGKAGGPRALGTLPGILDDAGPRPTRPGAYAETDASRPRATLLPTRNPGIHPNGAAAGNGNGYPNENGATRVGRPLVAGQGKGGSPPSTAAAVDGGGSEPGGPRRRVTPYPSDGGTRPLDIIRTDEVTDTGTPTRPADGDYGALTLNKPKSSKTPPARDVAQ